MNGEDTIEKAPLFATVRPVQFVQVLIIGLLVGVFGWIFAEVLGMYVLKPTSCSGDAFVCAASSPSAVILGPLLAALIGLFGLVKLQVFRPLLIVIVATLSVWGIVGELTALPWYASLAAVAVLSSVAYLTFMWLVRIRMFWLAMLLAVVLVVALRLIITA